MRNSIAVTVICQQGAINNEIWQFALKRYKNLAGGLFVFYCKVTGKLTDATEVTGVQDNMEDKYLELEFNHHITSVSSLARSSRRPHPFD